MVYMRAAYLLIEPTLAQVENEYWVWWMVAHRFMCNQPNEASANSLGVPKLKITGFLIQPSDTEAT